MVTCLYEAEYVVVRVTIVWIFYHNRSICTVFRRCELVCVVLVDDLMRNSLDIVGIGVAWLRCRCPKLLANCSYYLHLRRHRHWLSKLLQWETKLLNGCRYKLTYITHLMNILVPAPPLPPPPPPTALCRSLACCICIALLCMNICMSASIEK